MAIMKGVVRNTVHKADEVELDDVYETERQLLYVACTRARDRLMISGVSPGSEFLADLETPRHTLNVLMVS
jgi:ATP-dependent exoDNAse (exonuclease V) beta subunit